MINTKRYFKFHLTKRLPYFLITAPLSAWFTYITYDTSFTSDSITLLPVILSLFILSMLTPIMELSAFKKRKDLDNLFSLPIPRTHLLGVHLLTGLFTNLAVFTISVGIVALDFSDAIASEKMIYLLLFWVLGLIWGALIYGLFSFIFYEANTAWDGAVFVVAHSFALQMFFTGLIMVLEWFKLPLEQGYRLYNSVQLSPYVPFQWTKDFFEEKINPPGNYFIPWNYDMSTSGMLFTLIFYLILGVASYIVFFRFSAKKRVEKTGDISDSLFGYRTLLPMGAFLLFVVGAKTLVITIVALACTLGGYAIYRRGFHLKRSDWTILICLTAFSLMLSV